MQILILITTGYFMAKSSLWNHQPAGADMRYNFFKLFCVLLMCLVVSGCVASLAYYPSREVTSTPACIGIEYEDVWIGTVDEIEISGWWIPADGANKTVLFFHGNAGNMGDCLDKIRVIRGIGFNLLLIDYRGFGKSAGSPTEKGLFLDADAAMGYLVEKKQIEPGSIILWGFSLGGAVAARTAEKHHAGMLILESAFTSLTEAANDIFPWVPGRVLKNHSYDTMKYVKRVNIPTLVIHSVDDEIIPFHHGQRLYDAIAAPKAFIEIQGCHTQVFLSSRDICKSGIKAFVAEFLNF